MTTAGAAETNEPADARWRAWRGVADLYRACFTGLFVCTKQSVDGQDGLEGYYHEFDHPLDIDQRAWSSPAIG